MKRFLVLCALTGTQTGVAAAQVALDRADPTRIERTLPQAEPGTPPPVDSAPAAPPPIAQAGPITGTVRAIVVVGQDRLPPAVFAEAIAPVVGESLSHTQLAELAGAVADVARARGYPFATASIAPQPVTDGILRVTLDLGRIDAVRVVGVRSPAADRLLTSILATGAPVRQRELERALLLVGDLPGVRVTGSRLARQDGFGILLVTAEQDRASAYVQVDNRGSREVGPARSTVLASVRDVAQSADELSVIVSQTPLQWSEFIFARLRYAAPLNAAGTTAIVSGSLARSRPGGALAALDVEGRSADVAVAIQHPLLRSRARSLFAGVELRALGTDQDLAGQQLRRDRLATLTGTLNGTAAVAGGALRGEVATVAGLPVSGGTRPGSVLASRFDGDSRFLAASYLVDWTASLGKPFSVVLASAGQLASRPLLATAELGVGGPGFGRAYDYAERTGDEGILGSLELRADTGAIVGSVVDRAQLYGFVDGGVVGNLRGGAGGGSLLSSGVGARIGTGRFDWLVEVALPMNADRFDTGDKRPRISLRLARAF